jgi:hypothetical protein
VVPVAAGGQRSGGDPSHGAAQSGGALPSRLSPQLHRHPGDTCRRGDETALAPPARPRLGRAAVLLLLCEHGGWSAGAVRPRPRAAGR